MDEQFQQDDSLAPAPVEQNVAALLRKMQQQLDFLEKKIDTLIAQSSGKSFSERKFSKPYRSFGQGYNRGRDRDGGSGERSFERPRRFGAKRYGEESREFAPRKTFDKPADGSFSPPRHFRKGPPGEKRGFDPKSKPFSYRNKNR